MRSASSLLIGGLRRQGLVSSDPSEMFTPAWKNRHTRKVRGAIDWNVLDTLRLMPLIIDAMIITTITPMATPRMVSAARPLLPRSEASAIPIPSNSWVTRSLLPQGRDRVEPRGPARGVHPRDDPHAGAESHAQHDGPGRHARRQRTDGRDEP